jgi:hypothetical protein
VIRQFSLISYRDVLRLLNNYEDLVHNIQLEARNFQEENNQLRENLAALIEENNRLRSHERVDSIGVFKNEYIAVADKIFNNLRSQLLLSYKVYDFLIKFTTHYTFTRTLFLQNQN